MRSVSSGLVIWGLLTLTTSTSSIASHGFWTPRSPRSACICWHHRCWVTIWKRPRRYKRRYLLPRKSLHASRHKRRLLRIPRTAPDGSSWCYHTRHRRHRRAHHSRIICGGQHTVPKRTRGRRHHRAICHGKAHLILRIRNGSINDTSNRVRPHSNRIQSGPCPRPRALVLGQIAQGGTQALLQQNLRVRCLQLGREWLLWAFLLSLCGWVPSRRSTYLALLAC